jgi:hypothetical protein
VHLHTAVKHDLDEAEKDYGEIHVARGDSLGMQPGSQEQRARHNAHENGLEEAEAVQEPAGHRGTISIIIIAVLSFVK